MIMYYTKIYQCMNNRVVNLLENKIKNITIIQADHSVKTISCDENESLLEAMARQGIHFRADCGGRGSCGKCKIKLLQGEMDPTEQDRKIFSEKELQEGYRLSCKAYPKTDCEIKLIEKDEDNIQVETFIGKHRKDQASFLKSQSEEDTGFFTGSGYLIAIDLGTTTIAMNLISIASNKIVRTYTALNPQRVYGADVVSRMKASNEGKLDILRDLVRKELCHGILQLVNEQRMVKGELKSIAIAGNTTMIHLLMGYSCESLGLYPFQAVNLEEIQISFKDLFLWDQKADREQNLSSSFRDLDLQDVPLVILPGISTFVGGDIVAGLLLCGFHQAKKPCLLIDLGTNGELALGYQDKIYVSSTAAGPAFEGGNISCGVGSVPGAVCQVTIEKNQTSYQTIEELPPVGICGTGVIEMASELLKAGLMDDSGLLVKEYFEEGFEIAPKIILTQKDIRELQLAKAAIRAGVEILMKSFGSSYEDIGSVYLAGGFGFRLDIEKAIHIGLLPEELKDNIIPFGNSSLGGAALYLMDESCRTSAKHMISNAKEVHLAEDPDFYDLYISKMSF